MPMEKFKDPKAEVLRIKNLYRRLLLEGSIRIPVDVARRLIGPDCVFHLYGKIRKDKISKSRGI